jgi:hypothetical protein
MVRFGLSCVRARTEMVVAAGARLPYCLSVRRLPVGRTTPLGLWSNSLWSYPTSCFEPVAVAKPMPSTFLEVSLKFLFVARVVGSGSWMKVLVRSFQQSWCPMDIVPFLEASLGYFCCHPASLAGVALCCVVPTCASTYSLLWFVQPWCLVLPQSFGALQQILGR